MIGVHKSARLHSNGVRTPGFLPSYLRFVKRERGGKRVYLSWLAVERDLRREHQGYARERAIEKSVRGKERRSGKTTGVRCLMTGWSRSRQPPPVVRDPGARSRYLIILSGQPHSDSPYKDRPAVDYTRGSRGSEAA